MPEMPDGSFEIDADFAQQFIDRPRVYDPIEARRRYPKLFAKTPEQLEAESALREDLFRLQAKVPPVRVSRGLQEYREWVPSAMAPGEEPTLEQVVFEAMGFATTCWENLTAAGRFESDNLSALCERLVEVLRERGAR